MGTVATVLGFGSAERQWTTGYCVEIAVPEMDAGGSKTVAPGSTTPFTANVRHKFEGADLVVPVTATLGSGGVSVNPSGNPVPAPASFQFKAPDRDRQTAIVNLETHSKRGIATLASTFLTGRSAYTVDGTYFRVYHFTGTVCDLAHPFKLNADAPEIVAKGVFSFTPAGADGGTWRYAGKVGPTTGGALPYKGSGGYTVILPTNSTPGRRSRPAHGWWHRLDGHGVGRGHDAAGQRGPPGAGRRRQARPHASLQGVAPQASNVGGSGPAIGSARTLSSTCPLEGKAALSWPALHSRRATIDPP